VKRWHIVLPQSEVVASVAWNTGGAILGWHVRGTASGHNCHFFNLQSTAACPLFLAVHLSNSYDIDIMNGMIVELKSSTNTPRVILGWKKQMEGKEEADGRKGLPVIAVGRQWAMHNAWAENSNFSVVNETLPF
jgi:hypothetical protein